MCCIWVQLLLVKTGIGVIVLLASRESTIQGNTSIATMHIQLFDCKGSIESVVKREQKLKLITQV